MRLEHTSGKIIEIDDKTEDVSKLRNQLMLLGMNGLAYTDVWNNIAKKIKELEKLKTK